jgi:alpha-L-fucosidase
MAAAALLAASAASPALSGAAVPPPAPCGAVPNTHQLAWHALEYYGFVHFTVNTFTDKEWGYGDEPESVFNTSALDPRQWARVAREAGMKGLILTAKHHDGFCLWPSRLTTHSVKRSPWKNGRGDVVGEFVAACRAEGIKCGLYLSPWDRNHAQYGRPAYLEYYRAQLRELLTQYGPLFEIWFDGANGGDGFYGGAREMRRIDNATYYDWPNTWSIVRQLQPQAVMFSDAGPDVRWVGNESGVAFETSWAAINRTALYPGQPKYQEVAAGRPDGTHWVPPEVDVSIRPGWFYHASEDAKVKTAAQLMEIYYQSVGRGSTLLLNLPPDRRGRIHELDVASLREFRRMRDATFRTDLARRAGASASSTRGDNRAFSVRRVNDGNPGTYWAADDGATRASVELAFGKPVEFDRVVFQEAIAMGQRIESWTVEARTDGAWRQIAQGTTVGYKRIVRCPPTRADRVRLNITRARACPTLATLSVYRSEAP